jgi:phosphomannomutase
MLAHSQLSLPQLLSQFARRFPPLFNRETQVAKSSPRREKFHSLLQEKNFSFPGLELLKIKYIDGIKFIFTNSWLLLRESGTSHVIRICAEAPSLLEIMKTQKQIKILQQTIKELESEKLRLSKEIDMLRENPLALEEKAREKLWLMKKNEKVVVLVKDKKEAKHE